MTYFLGIVVILIGFVNIWLGYKGIASTNWNRAIYDRYPQLFRWMYMIGGAIIIGIGVSMILIFRNV